MMETTGMAGTRCRCHALPTPSSPSRGLEGPRTRLRRDVLTDRPPAQGDGWGYLWMTPGPAPRASPESSALLAQERL